MFSGEKSVESIQVEKQSTIIKDLLDSNIKVYNQCLLFYSANLVSHFPKDFSGNYEEEYFSINFNVNELSYRPPSNYLYRLVRKNLEINPNIDSLIENSILHINAFDTNSILVFSYLIDPRSYCDSISIMGMNQKESTKIGKSNLIKIEKLPIPYFTEGHPNKSGTFSGLDSTFTIYLIDAKPGIYTDITYLVKNEYLPKKWEHGFSRGIAVSMSKNQIIYWVTVW